jgi:glucose/arabinose dehydrogenase
MKSIYTHIATAVLSLSSATALAQGLDTRLVASGLSQPLFATAPLADGRVFVVEKGGAIKLVSGGATSTFLNIAVSSSGEQGLLGLAFDPGYGDATSLGYRRFFVSYIDPTNQDSVIASYRANDTGTAALTGSRTEVMRWDQPNGVTNHKAGWIGFKPGDSNNLFIATGDGGGGNDPFNNAQRLNTVLGKMLRININGDDFASANINYAVPSDNPFVGTAGARGEIFAYGLRNPWRNSFDRLTGDLWIADVGQGQREEVNFIGSSSTGGQHFGWRLREGDIATPGISDPPAGVPLTDPLWVYGRNVGASITGGYVVRDASSPLNGRYVFGDFVTGRVWSMAADGTPQSFASAIELTGVLNAGAGGPLDNIASFGEGARGELYIVDFGGNVVQVVPEPGTAAMLLAGVMLLWGARRARG